MPEPRLGDVYSYPIGSDRHCREGMAFCWKLGDTVIVSDTYWRLEDGDPMLRKVLSPGQLESATLLFNVNDVDPFKGSTFEYERYAHVDRFIVTSQAGLTVHRYLRKGAEPDLKTEVNNAWEAMQTAKRTVDAAVNAYGWATSEYHRLQRELREAEKVTAG